MSTQLEITRRPNFVGMARGARITLDGVEIASVGNGKTVTRTRYRRVNMFCAPGWVATPAPRVRSILLKVRPPSLQCRMKLGWFSNKFELTSNDGRIIEGAPVQAGHHGKMILILGILGFIFGIFGLAALVQGIADLTKMSRGQMDRSGELLTWIGTILGAIGFLANVLLIVLSFALGHR